MLPGCICILDCSCQTPLNKKGALLEGSWDKWPAQLWVKAGYVCLNFFRGLGNGVWHHRPSPVSAFDPLVFCAKPDASALWLLSGKKKALGARVPLVTTLLPAESSRFKILRKTLVDLAKPVSVRGPGDDTRWLHDRYSWEEAWSHETQNKVYIEVSNGFLLSELSPHGMPEIMLQNEDLFVSRSA